MANTFSPAPGGFARRSLGSAIAIVALVMGVAHAAVPPRLHVEMHGLAASADVTLVADWILRNNKHRGHPFIVADKVDSLLFAFDASGALLARTPALFGAAHSDALTEKQAGKSLDDTLNADKITPAGLFAAEAYLSPSYGESVRFARFSHTNLLIHRAPNAMRLKRLQSPTASDNRITYGCINALPEFVDRVLLPNYSGASLVAVLPEMQSAASFFAIDAATEPAAQMENPTAGESYIAGFLRHAGEYTPWAEWKRHHPARAPGKSADKETPGQASIGKIKADGKKRPA
jgi:hypothetical protein